MNNEFKERYNRHIILPEIKEDGQVKLHNSKVLVVGAGGLGSPVLTYLCAAGVGKIGIVDDDIVSLSNLQRQVLYTTNDLGKFKIEIAKNRLQAINPLIEIKTYVTRISTDNYKSIIDDYQIIVDCTDNYESRYIIDIISKTLSIPMVYGSISKFTGQVSVFNYKNGKSYKQLFTEQPEIDENEKSRLGVLGVLPGIIGSIQANEVIKILLNMDGVLSEKLFLLDSRTMQTNILNY